MPTSNGRRLDVFVVLSCHDGAWMVVKTEVAEDLIRSKAMPTSDDAIGMRCLVTLAFLGE